MASTENTCGAMQYAQSVEVGSNKDTGSGRVLGSSCNDAAKDAPKKEKVRRNLNIAGNINGVLHTIRDPLAEYQERNGTPRDESYCFIPLVTTLAQTAYNVTIAIFVMLTSFIPMFDGLLLCLRFILDKLIDIFESNDVKDKVMKTLIFIGELAIILIMTFLIMSLIIIPVIQLTWRWFGKLWGLVWNNS